MSAAVAADRRASLAGAMAGLRATLTRRILELDASYPLGRGVDGTGTIVPGLAEILWQLDVDFVFLIAESGLTVSGMHGGRTTTASARTLIGEDLDALLAADPREPGAVATSFALTRSGPALAAVTGTRHRGAPAQLVIGVLLDPELLEGLGGFLELSGLRFEPEPGPASRSLALRTATGALVGSMVWGASQPAPPIAGSLLSIPLPYVLVALVVVLALAGRLVRRAFQDRFLTERGIAKELRQALRTGALELHYQPQINLRDGCMSGAEALLRWSHPTRGAIAPNVFIPVAEKAGMMPELGGLVLRLATEEAVRWSGPRVAVNVSPLQFREPGLVAQVREALAATGLPAQCLELEITEGALIDDPAGAFATMRQLQELGVRIAIDDFGTGYSSLSYLHRFPFDKIKIDRSFTEQLSEHAGSRAVVEAVVRLARDLDASLCAEGIERAEQVALLTALGFEELQGFLFARPMPPEALRKLVSTPPAAWARAS